MKKIAFFLLAISTLATQANSNQELLRTAIVNNSPEQIRDAISKGASVNGLIIGKSPLLWAILLDKPQAIETLLENGSRPEQFFLDRVNIAVSNYTISPFAFAVIAKSCSNINEKYGEQKQTPLQYSLNRGDFATILWLLKNGADFSIPENDFFTTFMGIEGIDDMVLAIFQELLSREYPINNLWIANSWTNWSPKVVSFLIAKGANPNHLVNTGAIERMPLIGAITARSFKSVEILLNAGADINPSRSTQYSNAKITPLSLAVSMNEIRITELLLKHGASL